MISAGSYRCQLLCRRQNLEPMPAAITTNICVHIFTHSDNNSIASFVICISLRIALLKLHHLSCLINCAFSWVCDITTSISTLPYIYILYTLLLPFWTTFSIVLWRKKKKKKKKKKQLTFLYIFITYYILYY